MSKLLIALTFLSFFSIVLSASYVQAKVTPPDSNTPREKVPKEFQWKPTDIFPNDSKWESAYEKAMKSIPEILKYKGKLAKSSKNLSNFFKKMIDIGLDVEKVYVYTQYKYSGDEKNSKHKGMNDRGKMLYTEFSKATAWVEPELLKINDSKISSYINKEKDLKIYKHYFDTLKRKKEHILTEPEEALIAQAGDIFAKPEDIFQSLKTNIKFPLIQIPEKGKIEKVKLNFTNFTSFREHKSRKVRQANADKFFGTLNEYIETLTSTLDFAVKKNIFMASVRKYPSALGAALESNYFTEKVYDNLVSAISENLNTSLHSYIKLRLKVLNSQQKGKKLNKLGFFDLYQALVPSYDIKFSYSDGNSEIAEALAPLGKDYVEAFKLGSDPKNGWVDVYPNKYKHDGAYASELWGVHPYILLNYQNSLDDVSTTAHEYGHGLHYYFAEKKQPYIYSDVETMGTETAAILNELLLLGNLIKKSKNKAEKLYLLNRRLEIIRLTFFRQVLFSEFERKIHEEVEKKNPLTGEKLNKMYGDLIKKYYGPYFELSKHDSAEWAYIPHFYYNFYVWKYAAGISAAAMFAKNILEGQEGASEKYIKYLESGSSDYTMNLLKNAGIDLERKETYLAIVELFKETVKEFEEVYFKG